MSRSNVHSQGRRLWRERWSRKSSRRDNRGSHRSSPSQPPTSPANGNALSDRAGSLYSEIFDLCEDSEEMHSSMPLSTITSEIRLPADNDNNNNNNSTSSQSRKKNENGKAGNAASSCFAVFMPKPPPTLCTVHREPAKEFRVNKPGPNKGRTFYLCARPVGPGYDKGHERLREEVDHQYKFNFFLWTSDAMQATAAAATSMTGVASQGKRE